MKSFRACLDEPINTAVFIHEGHFIKNNLEHQKGNDIFDQSSYRPTDIDIICRKDFYN